MLINIAENNKKKITMEVLAKKVGMTREYIQAIKNGSKGQTLENLEKIAKALECYPSQLLPKAWQQPIPVISEKIDLMSKVIKIYEQLKLDGSNVNSHDVAKIISVLVENNAEDVSASEIKRMFVILNLPKKPKS